MGILDGLNPEQLEAVNHDNGPQLVIAGAGTGKTQVITRRIARLIADKRAKPRQILALTFTDKAAREMEDRLHELIGWESFEVPVMTFNAFGAELLARFASHIGRSTRGGLINDTQKALLLNQHLARISLGYYGPQTDMFEFLEGIVSYIGQLQNAGVSSVRYTEYVDSLRADPQGAHPSEIEEQADLAKLYALYEAIKAENGMFDYNDQLHVPLEILTTRPHLAQRLAREYTYVLVDEYQDTNAVQDALLRTFVGRTGNIFAVGDDDQAIYGFRGAEINNILAFADHFALAHPAVLVRNYRSGQAVLDAAYRLIQHNNPARLEAKLGINKRLLALHDDSLVKFLPAANASAELEEVLVDIEARLDRGEPAGDIAVLAATHAPLRALAKVMARRGIPYAISTSVSIFEQPEILSLWYLLKWLNFQATDEAIGHVILGPFIGWTANEYREVAEHAHAEQLTVEEALRTSNSPRAEKLCSLLDEWRGWAQEANVSNLSYRMVFETGVAAKWQQQGLTSERIMRVFDDLHRLLTHMQDFELVAASPDLGAYLATFPKPPALEVTEPLGDTQGVQLLTVHASKGLEFGVVYLVGVTQRNWSAGRGMGRAVPEELARASDLPADHEFRRLMYVAVTRAKRELIISAPVTTASGLRQPVSSFVGEMLGTEAAAAIPAPGVGESETKQNSLTKLQRFFPMRQHLPAGRLPFEDEDGWLDLSVTALGSYDFCPFEFYVQNVLKISQPVGPQLAFGSALHRVFESYYKTKLAGVAPDFKELEQLLEETWSNRGYSDKALAEADRLLAHKTLGRFFEREETVNRVIIGSEVPVRFTVPEAKLRLRGKIDALFGRENGFEIRDFKTGRTQTDAEKLSKSAKVNFQLRSYALACEQLRGAPPSAVVLDYVVTMVEGEAQLTPAILKNHREKLATLAQRIREHDFAPNPSAMHSCAAIRFYGTGETDE